MHPLPRGRCVACACSRRLRAHCAACVRAHAHPASLVFRLSPRVECALQEDKAVALSAALPAWDSARDLVCTL